MKLLLGAALFPLLALIVSTDAQAARHKRWAPRVNTAWAMNFDRSGADDSPEVYATSRPLPEPGGDLNAVKEAVAYCRNHTIGFLIKSEGTWGYSWTGPFYPVASSVDGSPALTQSWQASDDGANTAPFAPLAFLQGLPDSGLLRISVVDVYGQSHAATFRLQGVARVRAALARACGVG
jgi:hypothetical protein